MRFDYQPFSRMLSGRSKTTMPVLTSHACDQTWVAGSTTSIIESFLLLGRLVARANRSLASTGNGRRATYIERRLRLTAAHRERPCCSPACLPPEGTSWPSSRCICPDGSPAGGAQQPPPTMVLEENVRVSGVSPAAQRGGNARQR